MQKFFSQYSRVMLISVGVVSPFLWYGHTAYTYQNTVREMGVYASNPGVSDEPTCSFTTNLQQSEKQLTYELALIVDVYQKTLLPRVSSEMYEKRLRTALGHYLASVTQMEYQKNLTAVAASYERVQINMADFMQSENIATIAPQLTLAIEQYSYVLNESFIIASTEAEKQ